ncbi:MAG: pyruvate dehydrogenase (acetyl-transferring) E1 component subunit alpha [Chitinivibrionales bacterium]|nr:pyruvate dehydrogenase (acetyl-transferring) E1 component subunit alpha [Chitinivibrionales bacterium]MBD3394794.1 pyruvate dehydrogenase (acetyl-transferring) E1 component subunit alpha [Chitinivibrionales bacterium]
MYTIRVFESECIKLYRQGLIRGYYHPYLGEEAVGTGVCAALGKQDYIVSTHRGHGHCIARGADVKHMVAEVLGKETGYCLGLGGSMHIADITVGNLGANGIVGGGIPLGVGAALASKIRKEDRVVAIFFSDGASNNGVFAESLNLAGAWSLPVVFVLENNHYAVCTPVEKSCKADDLYTIGQGFGIESHMVDGNDVLEVYAAAQEAVAKCRKAKGPVLIEAKTYRHGGHHVNDPGAYMPQDRLEYFKSRDPVTLGKGHAMSIGKATKNDIAKIDKAVQKEMDEAVAFAKESPEMSEERFFELVENY